MLTLMLQLAKQMAKKREVERKTSDMLEQLNSKSSCQIQKEPYRGCYFNDGKRLIGEVSAF